jgi:hypothetical protein
MHDFAVTTLALSGKAGGTRLVIFIVLLMVAVILAAGWILCAARAREARVQHTAPARGDHPSDPAAKP